MNPTTIDQSIINQESSRLQTTAEQQIKDDDKAFKYAKVIRRDTALNLWEVEVEASTLKAKHQGNAAIAIGDVVHYYKAQGQNYGYIRTMPRA
jgi:hypothetical protein